MSTANRCETTDYDPRFDRAQTIEGAKARYTSEDCPDYSIARLERDVERILYLGKFPDKTSRPTFEGQEMYL